jgi:hypothetical protein
MAVRTLKYGRLPRRSDPRISLYKDLLRKQVTLPPLPATIDYTAGMPADLGMMLNSEIGDCTAAAVGHILQLWTFHAAGAGAMLTIPDSAVLALYEATSGYIPGDPDTDNGANEQTVLDYWIAKPVDGNELLAQVYVDSANMPEVYRAIWEGGGVYVGMNVPEYFGGAMENPGAVWDVPGSSGIPLNADTTIVDGHAFIAAGYELPGTGYIPIISWGAVYYVTRAFWQTFVDEAHLLANKDWIEASGMSPAGMSIEELVALMAQLTIPGGGGNHRHHHRRMRRRRRMRQQEHPS